MRRLQLEIPFPPALVLVPKKPSGPSCTELTRQPARHPPGSWRRYLDQGDQAQIDYERNWSLKRREAGLPDVILYPHPMRKPSEAASFEAVRVANLKYGCAAGNALLARYAEHYREWKKITSRHEGTGAGNAVSGRLCDPRRMPA
jgi:hypothetical protein